MIEVITPAIRPMIMYLILQVPIAVVGSLIIREREIGWSGVLQSWIMGHMMTYAILQVLAVPMILTFQSFNTLFWSYLALLAVVFGIACWKLKGHKIRLNIQKETWHWLVIVILIITVLLIVWQSCTYFFAMHLDEDDARWLAEANDALEYWDMMTRDFDNGNLLGGFSMAEDVSSPWPMMYAVSSRVLFTRNAVFAHTLYPPVAILMMYGIYWLIGRELFVKLDARLTFLLCTVILVLFYGGGGYSQGAFSLIRIWQGKASVAALVIPVLLYLFIRLNKENRSVDWIKVLLTACAACLMSGMGIFIAAIMIGVYGLYNIIAYRHWKRILLWLASLLPSVLSFLLYYSIGR